MKYLSLMVLLSLSLLGACEQSKRLTADESTASEVEAAIEEAVQRQDLRLFASSGRRITVPGLVEKEIPEAKRLCGLQFMPGTGDILTSDSQREKRKHLIEYMTSYNRVMFRICRQQAAN